MIFCQPSICSHNLRIIRVIEDSRDVNVVICFINTQKLMTNNEAREYLSPHSRDLLYRTVT